MKIGLKVRGGEQMIKALCHILLLAAWVAHFSGCIFLAAGAAGVSTAKWYSDKVSQEVNSPLARSVQVTKNALTAMDIKVYKETSAHEVTQLRAKTTDNKGVWVDVRPLEANKSRVEVRVDWLNGEGDARRILEEIMRRL